MYAKITEEIRELLEDASGESTLGGELQESQVADFASTIAFRLASKWKKNPKEIADGLAEKITKKIEPIGSTKICTIKKAEAVNGYVNFFINYPAIISQLLSDLREQESEYGKSKKKNKKLILEHTSINPSGPLHVGRLRNSLIGDCLSRVFAFCGYDVETHYFVNDVGKQIAIISRGFKEGIEPDSEAIESYAKYSEKEDFKIFFEYVSANRKFNDDDEFKDRVQKYIKDAESGDKKALDEISGVARRCLEGQNEIYKKLDIRFDKFDFESDYIKSGDVSRVLEFLKKSKYAKTKDGGFGLDLSEFGIERRGGISMLARSDGTSVYLVRDVAYHLQKSRLGDLMINVLGEDHKFEFQEVKTIIGEIYNVDVPLDVVHYSFVNFDGAELSTRKGQIAPVDKLIEDAISKAETEIEKRGIATKEAAPAIGIGAIKYHILKTSPQKPITFRWSEALSFEGDAAPYIQYAHARCCSIVEKSGVVPGGIDVGGIDVDLKKEEETLVRGILRFPGVVERTAGERKPNVLGNYLCEVAADFSRFYKECPVISAGEGVKERRLLLVEGVRVVLGSGLGLLGIEAPGRM